MELQGFIMKFLNKIYHNEIEGGREFVEKSFSFLSKKRNGLSEDGHSITSSDFNEWVSTEQLTFGDSFATPDAWETQFSTLATCESDISEALFHSLFCLNVAQVSVHSTDIFSSRERMVPSPPSCSNNLCYCWAQWARWAESLVGKVFWLYSSIQFFLLSQLPPSVLMIPEVPEKTH